MELALILIISIASAIVLAVLLYVIAVKVNPCVSKKRLQENEKGNIEVIKEEGRAPVIRKIEKNGSVSTSFRVVSCTDMHLGTEAAEFGITLLSRLIDRTNPDLLVLCGDNCVNGMDDSMEKRLIAMLEKKNVHYAFVLGNHDSEKLITDELSRTENIDKEKYEAITKKWRTYKYKCLSQSDMFVGYFGDPSLYGGNNYDINVETASGIKQTLYFIDSGDYAYGVKRKAIGTEKRSYDYLHQDQCDWFASEADKYKTEGIVFIHIPLVEYFDAYKQSISPFSKTKKIYGNNYEKPCSSDVITDAFDVLREHNAKIVVAGHDHKNDTCILYKGVKLMYSQGLQYDGSYNRHKKAKFFRLLHFLGVPIFIEGVTVFDIKDDGDVDITPVYAEKEKVYEGLEKYYKRAFIKKPFPRK